MAIQVDPTVNPRIITVPEADGASITTQSLVDQIRAWEDNQANLCYSSLLSASGKEDLGGEVFVGITANLKNAKLKFAARSAPTTCYVGGGNLLAVDGYGVSMFPIEPSTNVTVQLTQSSSATMIQSAIIEEIQIQVGETQYQIAGVQETVDPIKDKTDTITWADINKALQILKGRWKIINSQMIFYNTDNQTPIVTFNLKDKSGRPAESNVYERIPV